MVPAQRDQDELAREAHEREEKAASDGKLVLWTAVVGVATIFLAGFTCVNLWLLRGQGDDLREQRTVMQQQAGHLEEQATQLKASVAQMKDTTQQQLRAYLIARPGNLIVDEKRRPGEYWLEWHPEIVNTGQTPAYDVRVASRAQIRDEPLPPGTNLTKELDPKGTGSQGVLGREQMIWQSCNIGRGISESELKDLRSKRSGKAWYVWGVVTYRDIFGNSHSTKFCNLTDWDSQGKPMSRSAPEHNEAD